MNKKQLVKCVRDGAMETNDLTDTETFVAGFGVGYGAMGVAGIVVGKVAAVPLAVLTGQYMAAIGGALCVGAVGKAFIRGFREQWKIEMKHNNKK